MSVFHKNRNNHIPTHSAVQDVLTLSSPGLAAIRPLYSPILQITDDSAIVEERYVTVLLNDSVIRAESVGTVCLREPHPIRSYCLESA